MDRRDLLRGLLALPVASALGANQHKPKDDRPRTSAGAPGKLSVVIDGAFAVVIEQDRRSRVRVFTPRDRENRHQFYFVGKPERDVKSSLRPQPTDRVYHFELTGDSVQTYGKPEIDARLNDFSVSTNSWCQEEYFVTIDLPAPKRITFMPPLTPVTLRDGHRRKLMPFNHVLEYDIADRSKVRMELQGAPDFSPLSCTDLIKLYEEECRRSEEGVQREHGSATDHNLPPCSEVREKFGSACPDGNAAFFFGVGLPPHNEDPCHAVRFFNERILESFPKLRERLEIESFGLGGKPCPGGGHGPRASLEPALWRRAEDEPRLREISYVADCKVAGPLVSFPQ